VPVYPIPNSFYKAAMDDLGNEEAMLGNRPVWRGDALNFYEQGAAGLQMFNFFDPNRPQWRELGDPKKLLTRERTYVWDYLPSQRQGRDTFGSLRITRHRWPVTVTIQGCEPMPLYVGEDLSALDPGGPERTLTLRVRARGLTARPSLTVAVNGQSLPVPQISRDRTDQPADVWLVYAVPGETFKKGENLVTAILRNEAGEPVRIDQVRLEVRYAEGEPNTRLLSSP
jgi:hypothetical protein